MLERDHLVRLAQVSESTLTPEQRAAKLSVAI